MHPDAEQNLAATERLRALVGRLTPGDLARSLGGGWSVVTALGHLAFWDGRQLAVLRHFVATDVLLGSEAPEPHNPDDLTNEALEPVLLALDPSQVGELALGAADRIDRYVAGLDPDVTAQLLAGEHAYVVRRWRHRHEHIDQIQRELG